MRNMEWMAASRHAVAAAVAVVIVAAAAPALAQNTTAAIGGRLTGPDGRGIAGASVAVLHNASGSLVTATTDAEGRYVARGLRVGGPYTITFTKDGQTEKREDVYLALAESLALDATLGGSQTITVTGAAIASDRFNRSNMGAGTAIGSRELNAQASIGRNLQDYARADPRLSQTDKERGEISVAGQNSRYNSITIDGVAINDTFGLKANNLPTLKQPISIDAIQSVQVNVSNYDTTQKGYTGANINAVTKSGTNEFHGSVSYVFRNDSLAGDRYNRTTGAYASPPEFKETLKGFTLGGPIVEDKLFFFVGYEELKSTRAAPDFGPAGDSKTNVAITPAAITSAAQIASQTYGLDIGSVSAPATELTVKDTLLKLDWNISDNHRANLRYTKTEQVDPQLNNINSGALSFNSNWHDQRDVIETLVGQWFADWTSSFSTELKVSRREYESLPSFSISTPQVGLNFTGALPSGLPSNTPSSRTLFFGTERSRQFNQLRTKTNDLYLAGNWQLADHELKGGVDISRNEIFNAFLQDTFGNYTFRCLNTSADPASPVSYEFNGGAGLDCSSATQADVEAAVLENYRRGRVASYRVQVGANGPVDQGAASWHLNQNGVFLQDTWNVSRDLTLMGGVRVDQQKVPDRPLANTAAAAPMVAGDPATNTRQSGGFGLDNTQTLDGVRVVQPRFGFNWKLSGKDERPMQLRGGVGLFQGAAATVWLSNPFSNTGVATRIIACGSSGFPSCPTTTGLYSPNPATQPTNVGGTPAANVDFLDPNLSQPSVWKANLAFDAELPWAGIVAGAEWLHTKTRDGIYYQHLNLGTPTRRGPDGRELFYTSGTGGGYDPACWQSTGATVSTCTGLRARALSNPNYGDVMLASHTSKGGGDVLTLSLSQPARDGLGWSAAYSRTSAKEVSPLTSSVSSSNFNARSVVNPNEEAEANSPYLVRDRVSASLTWSRAFWSSYRTTVGVFYEGRKGKPYSWTFNNDMNGDGQGGNDLMYIPTAPGSGEVVFGGAGEDAFWQTVNAYRELDGSRGGFTKRNGSFSPFVNTFDVRVSQELPGFMAKHKSSITLDILNFGNLLNKKWGRTDEVAFQSAGGQARSFVNYGGIDAEGRYIYNVMPAVEDLTTRQARGESQWAAQITLKYEF